MACTLLVRPSGSPDVGLIIPLSLTIVAVSSLFIARLFFFANSLAIGPFIALQLSIGLGVGMSHSLRSSVDESCTVSELFRAAGVALAQTMFLHQVLGAEVGSFDRGRISMMEIKSTLGDRYAEGIAWGFVASVVFSVFFAALFGIPKLITVFWMFWTRRLQRQHSEGKKVHDILLEARPMAERTRKRKGKEESAVEDDSLGTLASLLPSPARNNETQSWPGRPKIWFR